MISDYSALDEHALFHLWSQQLFKEFENICWNHRITLSTPSFEIMRAKNIMGRWSADSRTIQLNSLLIYDYPWQTVLNVLKHEMAHQICSELFNPPHTGHGPDFQRACDMLAVPPAYCGATGDLPDNIGTAEGGDGLTAAGRKFIARVEKLLALAKSDNENEAALAMQKANELIEKYNLKLIAASEPSPYTYIILNPGKKKIQRYQRSICGILRDFFHVKVVYSYLYAPWHDCENKTIELLGTVENVTIAEYCYHFLDQKIAALWRQNKAKYKGNGLRARNSYYAGVLRGFYDKLHRQKARPAAVNYNLAIGGAGDLRVQNMLEIEKRQLTEYVFWRFPRLRVHKTGGAVVYSDSFNAGIQDGKEINLHKGLNAHDGNLGKLLSA